MSMQLVRSKEILYRLRNYVNEKIFSVLYDSLGYCHLYCCINALGSVEDIYLHEIMIRQNNIIRTITQRENMDTSPKGIQN